jgi:iron(III) transport system ATP-binding protein
MGSNNHLSGRVTQLVDGRALLEGEGWRLWGAARGSLKSGDAATGIIRLERTRIASAAGDNRLRTELVTGMFLGDRKENLFKLGNARLRCYGTPVPTAGGRDCYLELPQEDLWIFAAPAAPAA